jgi:hypothetical protein
MEKIEPILINPNCLFHTGWTTNIDRRLQDIKMIRMGLRNGINDKGGIMKCSPTSRFSDVAKKKDRHSY